MSDIERFVQTAHVDESILRQGGQQIWGDILRRTTEQAIHGWAANALWRSAKEIPSQYPLLEFPEFRLGVYTRYFKDSYNFKVATEIRSIQSENRYLAGGYYSEPAPTERITYAQIKDPDYVWKSDIQNFHLAMPQTMDNYEFREQAQKEGKLQVKAQVQPVIQQIQELKEKWVQDAPEKWDLLEVSNILENLKRAVS